jgi:hypothetical protein
MTPNQASLLRIFLWLLLALGFGIIALVAEAQLPDAPKPHRNRVEFALLAADAASRGLDVYSTRRMIANGHKELFLPQAIAKRPAAMAAMEAGYLALQYWAARKLEKTHHRKLARIALAIDIGQDAPWAIRNLYLNREKTAPALRPRLLPAR